MAIDGLAELETLLAGDRFLPWNQRLENGERAKDGGGILHRRLVSCPRWSRHPFEGLAGELLSSSGPANGYYLHVITVRW